MPSKNDVAIKDFLEGISNAKLKNFASSEKSLVTDKFNGFRLDHQGVSQEQFHMLHSWH
jgi:hypothetical protein